MDKQEMWIVNLMKDAASYGILKIAEWTDPSDAAIEWCNDALVHLDDRRYAVLKYRYLSKMTYTDIGRIYSISQERARQLVEDSKRKLRYMYRGSH